MISLFLIFHDVSSISLELFTYWLYFLHRKELPDAEVVFSREANEAIPQMVIKYYESKIVWHDAANIPNED